MNNEETQRVIDYGKRHLEFCIELYKIQHENGLYFLHEHPHGASSWNNNKVQELLKLSGIQRIKSHMCAFGMTDEDSQGRALVKKPTGLMTNACKIAETLANECKGDHRHVVLIGGGRAKRAEVYPNEFCKTIIFGLRD